MDRESVSVSKFFAFTFLFRINFFSCLGFAQYQDIPKEKRLY
jgi:hypothetical protein